ncbi:hypothetical protein JOC78_000282 [Bacillus ectoiniformans]|uniref:hypothetical protein n=1 Tax=Bacillus ectoiniformans TaxID=1494429 RepID=UPI00195D35FB|nr:hypothetical protein [Bacillus ectoiniformans]MBM7647361.1 hypothetical protein [Bacillus ectoiniformans]
MKISPQEIALTSLLAALIAVTGMIKLPSIIPGAEFQLSAPIGVAIAAAFGIWRYLCAGVIASSILLLLGLHTIINVEVAMAFRVAAAALIGVFGTRFLIVSIAGPLSTLFARLVLSLTLGVPFIPLLLAAVPGMIFTVLLSWPLYKALKLTIQRAGVQLVQRPLQHKNEIR